MYGISTYVWLKFMVNAGGQKTYMEHLGLLKKNKHRNERDIPANIINWSSNDCLSKY